MKRIATKLRSEYNLDLINAYTTSVNETNMQYNVEVEGFRGRCSVHSSDFRNSRNPAGWDQKQGEMSTGRNGYRLNSHGLGSSRIRLAGWHFGPRNGEVSNYIKVYMRAAPDSGKNSYVCLRESTCADSGASNCDEIDIVEAYGKDGRAEAMSYHGGQRGTLYTLARSGSGRFHTYELWQTPRNGHYTVAIDGHRSREFTDGPHANLMMFYVGIWDCTVDGNRNTDWCGRHTTVETYMELQTVYIQQCFP